jgi:large subunit ribosomal protein L24
MHVKKGDKVIVIAGKDKGKTSTVVRAMPSINKVVLEGINMAKKHVKKTRSSAGQMVDIAMPIHASNVKLADGKAKKEAKPAKAKSKTAETKVAKKTTKKED